ncbi:5-formyltetrahydrofolate cyclo-ligase [Salinimonas sp. HHU 13199]|uniref:5-formyltetrahydrofolate cyclo-ligase n=1 Tax=Salinimonas profundi TaxID=2729140 RepID=A0ABR8LQY8_9ALTE|nr:5-formyltetrahydrofolate cyclo-ligase [Salinimonas profundi]MBD3586535.1 5-formyltetrahydrofolate cyclo-ligase [Salinimonas profundi]
MTDLPGRGQLRQQLREARRALSPAQQQQASSMLAGQLQSLSRFTEARRIAAYLANDGEPELTDVISHCQLSDIAVSLPVLHPLTHKHLLFLDYHADTPMRVNRFNIAEPALATRSIRLIEEHDLILMPLVGFDAQGNRLGMGGGFYDRTLAHHRDNPHRPLLAGIAHTCQQVEQLPVAPWDVPCDIIVTPDKIWLFDKSM